MRSHDHDQQGPARFAVEASAGEVQVRAGQGETARVRLEPVQPGDAAAERLIERARITSDGDRLAVQLPDDEPFAGSAGGPVGPVGVSGGYVGVQSSTVVGSVIQSSGSVITTGGGNTINGVTISGNGPTVISGGQVVSGGGGSTGVRVVAELPADSHLRLDGVSTSLHTTGELGSVEATTLSGGIRIDRARTANLRSTSGDVSVAHSPDVQAKTISGDVSVDSLAGKAHLRSTSGDVRVHATGDSTVNARCTSGDVTVSALEGVRVEESVKTVSGQVRRRTVPTPTPAAPSAPSTPPAAPAAGSGSPTSGGSDMSGIDDVRATLAGIADSNGQHAVQLRQLALSYELAATHVEGAAYGSSAAAVSEAIAGYQGLAEEIRGLVARSEAITEALADYANTL